MRLLLVGLQEDLDFAYELMIKNLTIQNNIFNVCSDFGIDRVLLQGSTCSYPAEGSQPYTEDQLMNGEPYKTYLPTALPKLMGMYQCRAKNEKAGTHWRTAINSNMFGPGRQNWRTRTRNWCIDAKVCHSSQRRPQAD